MMCIQRYGKGLISMYKCMYTSCKKSNKTINGYEQFIIISNSNATRIQLRTLTFCFISMACCWVYTDTVDKIWIWMTSELLVRPLPNSSTIDPGVKSTVSAI